MSLGSVRVVVAWIWLPCGMVAGVVVVANVAVSCWVGFGRGWVRG